MKRTYILQFFTHRQVYIKKKRQRRRQHFQEGMQELETVKPICVNTSYIQTIT